MPARTPSFDSLVNREPEHYQSPYQFIGVAQLGTDTFPFVLDSSDYFNQGYNILYFDLNKNGDLTDDGKFLAHPLPEQTDYPEGYFSRSFPRMDVSVNIEGATLEYAFTLEVFSIIKNRQEDYATVRIRTMVYRAGEINLDGKTHRIALLDSNSNARFDDLWNWHDRYIQMGMQEAYLTPGDLILIDPNQSDRRVLGYDVTGRPERQMLSKLLFIDGKYYQVRATPSGDQITLTPFVAPMGTVSSPNPSYSAVVGGELGFLKVTGNSTSQFPLPAGDWQLIHYLIDYSQEKPEEKNTSTTLISARATRDIPITKVREGQNSLLAFGAPFRPVVEVASSISRLSFGRSEVRLAMKLVGSVGEICSNLTVNDRTPKEPIFVITTRQGKIIERGNFEYG